MKLANTKVSEKDMIYFSLGLEAEDYVLPSQRNDYHSDARAVKLVEDIRAGRDLSGQDFSGINLKGADISGGHFAGASFKGAIFYQTDARGADFTDCDFTEAYFEDTDLSEAILTGADFSKTYLRRLKTKNTVADADFENRLSVMEVLIQKLESGEIEIHSLTRSELMCLDLRRLDLSKIDLSGLDLSMFNLEGVNLRGVYINPLQKLSMDNWQKDLLDVQKLQEKKLKEETLKSLKNKRLELETYAKQQLEVLPPKAKNPSRPAQKKDEFERTETPPVSKPIKSAPTDETDNSMVLPDNTPKPRLIHEQIRPQKPKEKKHKNRT
ncbi:MAG: pentapeptide repeat-containing protein [Alphaproteobacteria bacterium]|nr:pentapeptide repeat-containing protein [Alphaproteobacteria bacterium]